MPLANGRHDTRDPFSPGTRIQVDFEDEPEVDPTEDYEGATRPAQPQPQPSHQSAPQPSPRPPQPGRAAGPMDPADVAFRAARAGMNREQALDLAARAGGISPDTLPDPEAVRRVQGTRQHLQRALAEAEQRLAELPTLPVLAGLITLGAVGVCMGVSFDANAISPAYSELDHDPVVRLALSAAAVCGAILSCHLALGATSAKARWGFGALTALLLCGSAIIRALYGTPLGLTLLGMPLTTTQGPLTVLSQAFNALAATTGSVMLATASLTLITRFGPDLAAYARLKRNRSNFTLLLEDHEARAQADQALAAAQASRAMIVLAQAELAYQEGLQP